jgi:hypothetical protein
MKLIIPSAEEVKDPTTTAHSKTISLVLGDNNRVHYYHGLDRKDAKTTDYSAAGIRTVLQQKIQTVNRQFRTTGETVVLIKPTIYASYQNIIDILDEILVNDVKKHVLMDVSREEIDLLAVDKKRGKSPTPSNIY